MSAQQSRNANGNTQLLTRIEAAEFLRLSPDTLRTWSHMGKGPRFLKFGRAVRYRLDDLIQWVEGNVVETEDSG